MNSRSYYHPSKSLKIRKRNVCLLMVFSVLLASPRAFAGDVPGWMRALISAPLPQHDEKTDAVRLYSETIVTVQPNGKIKALDREVYKILRPDGKEYGRISSSYDSE